MLASPIRLGQWAKQPYVRSTCFRQSRDLASHLAGLTQARIAMQRRAALPNSNAHRAPPFEHWRLTLRMAVLSDLERYLEDWPETFIRDATRAHVYRCRFDSQRRLTSPLWLVQAISAAEEQRQI